MDVGSWSDSPACPPLDELEKMLQEQMNQRKEKKEKVPATQQHANGESSGSGEKFGGLSKVESDESDSDKI